MVFVNLPAKKGLLDYSFPFQANAIDGQYYIAQPHDKCPIGWAIFTQQAKCSNGYGYQVVSKSPKEVFFNGDVSVLSQPKRQ